MNYARIIRLLTIVCTSDCLVRFKFNRQPLNQLEYCLYKMKNIRYRSENITWEIIKWRKAHALRYTLFRSSLEY